MPRLLLIILLLPTLLFAQDNYQVDALAKPDTLAITQPVLIDSLKHENKPTRKSRKPKIVNRKAASEDSISRTVVPAEAKDDGGIGMGILFFVPFFGLLIYIIIRSLYRYFTGKPDDLFYKAEQYSNEQYTDEQLRLLLSRRDYYRSVYLRSAAWKRKRYVVLKRDNWTCVYCGSKATQVHHTRYAKWQIGKEPIEWLVSVCSTCHEDIHQ